MNRHAAPSLLDVDLLLNDKEHPAMANPDEQLEGSPPRPLASELLPFPDIVAVFRRLAALPHCLFLDSAMRDDVLGRYSFVAADPFEFWTIPADGTDAIRAVQKRMCDWPAAHRDELPPYQGGAAGLFGYDLNRSLERLPLPRHDEFQIPALALGCYDVVIAFDHLVNRAWIISQGLPEVDHAARQARARSRLEQMRAYLNGDDYPPVPPSTVSMSPVCQAELAAQYPTGDDPRLTSNFSAEGYCEAIRRTIEYIRAGDVFQVNLAQRLLYPAEEDSLNLYLRLRRCNPATFSGFLDLGAFQIVSASPERFLAVRGTQVETRPIKGTRARCRIPEADLFAANDLRGSEKDRAENVMIVDLLRNDISRVCRPETVHVSDLCRLEVYQYVQHLVSVVRGELSVGQTPLDLLHAVFPGGSITGAPKVRAMEIIAELEPTTRGAYCGSLGYLGFDGTLDLNILIRTITAGRGWWQFPVGGGIVAQSDPAREYDETCHKAIGLVRALRP